MWGDGVQGPAFSAILQASVMPFLFSLVSFKGVPKQCAVTLDLVILYYCCLSCQVIEANPENIKE